MLKEINCDTKINFMRKNHEKEAKNISSEEKNEKGWTLEEAILN